MNSRRSAFRRRLSGLLSLLGLTILSCVLLALTVQRSAKSKLRELAGIELEAAKLARQFRAQVDDLHGALLRVGTDAAEDSAAVIAQRRQRLIDWLSGRLAAARSPQENQTLHYMQDEVQSYFLKLDGLTTRSEALTTPLDRETIVMFDDTATRLQSMADDFAAAHDSELRDLLQGSLDSLVSMRNLVFLCLALLILAISVVVALLYRDVVRPLREQLVDREALLLKREKLAALGTLAAGVAHEIRNPLTAIKARLFTLRRSQATEDGRHDVQAISGEVDRLERIVKDVLGYARPAEPALGKIELATWLRDFAAFVDPELKARQIQLTVTTETSAEVFTDPDQLKQIMLNLVRNAQDALATDGENGYANERTPSNVTSRQSPDGRRGRILLSLRRERKTLRGQVAHVAVLAVTDDGPGIALEIQPRLFDPFFTTKAAGTGLGLSIVARLVENQGGEIAFQSTPGAGSCFSVHLPISDSGRQTAAP